MNELAKKLEGLWVVKFGAGSVVGTGVVVLLRGLLLGGDDGYYYKGSYEVDERKIKGVVDIIRYDPCSVSVLGDRDSFRLELKGELGDNEIEWLGLLRDANGDEIQVYALKKVDL